MMGELMAKPRLGEKKSSSSPAVIDPTWNYPPVE
jgi:hypothetical protein